MRTKNTYNVLLYTVFFIILSTSLIAQTRTDLEKKHQKTQDEIKYTNSLLKKTQRDKKISMNQLVILNKKIAARQELINTITTEKNELDKKIEANQTVVLSLEGNLKVLTDGYAKMIVFAYKTRTSYDKVVFILAANDFNMAYRRLKYLQQYADYRKRQMEKIISTRQNLSQKISELQQKKEVKEVLLNEEKTETQQLASEKDEHAKILTSLKSKEKELSRKLAEQKLADQKLKNAINDLIAAEIRKAEAARKEKLKKEKASKESNSKVDKTDVTPPIANKTTKPTVFDLTPAEQIVSDKFEINKGKLPWPIERGVITGTFGEHDHPVLKGIKVKNDGVYISTTQGSSARVIFDGVVSKIISIPGKNKAIIIRHGNFLTVYSNLKDVCVNVGDKLKAKQKIGTVFTDGDDDNKTVLELQIWQGTLKQNPESWLSNSN
jgi:septal ring factor EnvC (AmiA/AmiB activator)